LGPSEILYIKININSNNPINVGISTYVDLPSFIRKTKSVINIKNNDNTVFCGRVSSYTHFSKLLKYDGIKFPIALKDIPKFEMMNALSINERL
jgi:hypothetical protein